MPIKLIKNGENVSEPIPFWEEMNRYADSVGLDLTFEWMGGQYRLHSDRPEELPIGIEIDGILSRHEDYFKRNSIHKEILARALGVKGSFRPKIVDLSAGLLGDSLLFLSFGCEVVAVERNPLIAFLITNALKEAKHPALARFQFHFQDADSFLKSSFTAEALYFDPMFEDANEKASPRKEMRIFRNVIGQDLDAEELWKKARDLGIKRLVVKRPRHSKPLGEKPGIEYEGKATRYDVYLPKTPNPLQF